jgi:hypothetical protein
MDMFSRKRITSNRELEVGWDPVTGMAAGGEVSGDRRGGMPARLRRRDKQRERWEFALNGILFYTYIQADTAMTCSLGEKN